MTNIFTGKEYWSSKQVHAYKVWAKSEWKNILTLVQAFNQLGVDSLAQSQLWIHYNNWYTTLIDFTISKYKWHTYLEFNQSGLIIQC